MTKILFITNVPSPYRIDFFNLLGDKSDLTVIFEKSRSKNRKTYWDNYRALKFREYTLNKGTSKSSILSFFKAKRILKENINSKIVVCGFSSLLNVCIIFYLKVRKIPYYIEIDGGSPNLSLGKLCLKERLKKFICRGAKGYFSSGKTGDEYLLRYGAIRDKIYRYSFTSLYKKDICLNPIDVCTKKLFKQKYGLIENKCILTIARFNYQGGLGKGLDIFATLAKRFSKDNVGFYIIGDEPNEYFVNLKKDQNIFNLHFLPFFPKEKLFEIYKASDINMILSRGDVWGLVVNESLGNGVPVISSDLCLAGKELIKDEYNGYVVGLNNVDSIESRIRTILNSEIKNITKNCIDSIKKYTFENMVKEHLIVLGEEHESMD